MAVAHSTKPTREHLDTFLEQWCARDLILSFDSEFDVPFAHKLCIGLLEMLANEADASSDPRVQQATWLGSQWCRIVRADVTYQLAEGLDAIVGSQTLAEQLKTYLAEPNGADPPSSEDDKRFVAYVTARWYDGAGKIFYRCADYSNARLHFDAAKAIATEARLWHCLPDIVSNWLRADYEERTLVAQALDLAEAYRQQVSSAEEQAGKRLIPLAPDTVASLATEQREFLRGLSSLYHNLAVELMRAGKQQGIADSLRCAQLNESLQFSRKSETICRALDDGYRLGQALNHQAFLARHAGSGGGLAQARNLFEQVLQLKGDRSRRIAMQNLASMDMQEGHLVAAHKRLQTLLKELRADRERRGGDLGLDNLFHYETVQRWRDVLAAPKAECELGAAPWKSACDDAETERVESVRSIRRVVKISQYKQSFSLRHYPVYREAIGRAVEALKAVQDDDEDSRLNKSEEVCAWVEEASGRELMDLLASAGSNREKLRDIAPIDPIVVPSATDAVPKGRGRQRRSAVVQRNFDATDMAERRTLAALEGRRADYERYSLGHPIATASFDPELAHDLRMFTGNNRNLVVVRYFLYELRASGGKSGDSSVALAAFVFWKGDMRLYFLDWQAVHDKILTPLDASAGYPDVPLVCDAKRMFTLLVKPWWNEVIPDGPAHGRELVLIPADELYRVPLHVCLVDNDMPLCSVIPTVYSVSASAFLHRRRHLLRRQQVHATDDLCAVLYRDENASCEELIELDWPEKHFLVAGSPPDGIRPHTPLGKASWAALDTMSNKQPEFFLYAGHGLYGPQFGILGPALVLEGDLMTQYDVALRLRLPHNKLTILGACVSGQGGYIGGGEVSGFLRAFMAAGAGALGVTLWRVLDNRIVAAVRHILSEAQAAAAKAEKGGSFDVVQVYFEYCQSQCRDMRDVADRIEACPIALYL